MKIKLIIALLISLSAQGLKAQLKAESINPTAPKNGVYEIIKTDNYWTYLKLNTRNGKIWQVQISLEEENRFETVLNTVPLIKPSEEYNHRFALYPSGNIYNFVLLDKETGNIWQVQWSTSPGNRSINPIPNISKDYEKKFDELMNKN